MWTRRCNIGSWDPDVVGAVPAVIAGVPRPVAMLRRRRWNALDWPRRRRTDADDYLGLGDACCQKEGAGGKGNKFLHCSISSECFILLIV
jgi:hypothetical protein